MRLRFASLACAASILGCSASAKPSLVGTWSWDDSKSSADKGRRFNADGTYEDWFRGKRINNWSKGTYKVEGATLSVTVTQHQATSGKVSTEPSTSKESLRWITPDKIELTDAQTTGTMTRRDPGSAQR